MAIHDPKTLRKQDDDVTELRDQIDTLQSQVEALLAAKHGGGALDESRLETILLKVAQVSAEAQERAINPSNRSHPGISVYSYPEGDRARPRTLKCPMFWVGYDLREDTTTAQEIELLNRATPGTYMFRRLDGSNETLTVTGVANPDGSIAKLQFDFPVRERRDSLPSMAVMLQQALGVPTDEQRRIAELEAQLKAIQQTIPVAV